MSQSQTAVKDYIAALLNDTESNSSSVTIDSDKAVQEMIDHQLTEIAE